MNLNFKIIINLLKKNIRKIEKDLGFFLDSGNVSIQSNSYQSIVFSIKNIFDEKKLDKKVITNLVQVAIQKFYIDEQSLSIIHIIINKYIIDDNVYTSFPNDLKFKKKQIKVVTFNTLTTDFCKKMKSNVILRGLRATSDFEYEFQLSGMNKKLNDKIETIFLMSDPQNQIISSKLVKEIADLKGNVKKFTTKSVLKHLKLKLND